MTDPLSADLAQVLASLHRAGKIATPWLPGMLVDFVPGQRVTHPGASSYPRRIASHSDIPRLMGENHGKIVVGPVVDDPPTMGGLLALVREAHGDPGMHAVCARDRSHWWVYYCGGFGPAGHGPTEAHALLAALRAALPTETP